MDVDSREARIRIREARTPHLAVAAGNNNLAMKVSGFRLYWEAAVTFNLGTRPEYKCTRGTRVPGYPYPGTPGSPVAPRIA
eukprot:131518-Rhodomonas_salina.1